MVSIKSVKSMRNIKLKNDAFHPFFHMDVFSRLIMTFVASNSEKMPYIDTKRFVWNGVKSVFSAQSPIKSIHQRGARDGVFPLLPGELKGVSRPPHLQESFGLVRGSNWPQVDLKVTCKQRWKAFNSISIYWEVTLQHFEISFDGKINAKQDFFLLLQILDIPRFHGNRTFKIGYDVTKAMVNYVVSW
jgi:hypothetical protein